MLLGTLLVGMFPLIFIGSIAVNQGEKKYGAIADDINQKSKLPPTNSIKVFNIHSGDIRYIEAMQNYIRIWHVDDGTLSQKTERATLTTIAVDLELTSLKRCHRSYIVNTSSVLRAEGNAQGLQLTLKDVTAPIPVSRKYVNDFR